MLRMGEGKAKHTPVDKRFVFFWSLGGSGNDEQKRLQGWGRWSIKSDSGVASNPRKRLEWGPIPQPSSPFRREAATG